jgi:predicted phage baseplate assembly protein
VRFGDGDLGHAPEACTTFKATYRVGNGPAGNVGADTIVNLRWINRTVSGVSLAVRNPLPATGGTAPESIADAKLIAPRAFRKEIRRAITADDYAHLAERQHKAELQRAGASLRWTGSWFEARVVVDPIGSQDPRGRLLRDVARSLYPYRRMGHDLRVRQAAYVPLDVALDICVLPHYLRGHVEAAAIDALRRFFAPDNLTFGRGIFLTSLVAVVQAIAGVESVRVRRLSRLGEPDESAIVSGVLQLGPLEIARLDNDSNFPEHGTLTLTMAGGR